MSLRVTQPMMATRLLSNINNNLRQMDNLQNQLATGRKINAPSDDPVGITYALRYRGELDANDEYTKNVDSATSELNNSDTMLDQAGNVLQRVRELTVQAANGSNPQSALTAIQTEVDTLYSQLVEIGNSKFNGKYVFNGQLTDQSPYSALPINDTSANPKAYNNDTDTGDVNFTLSAGVNIPVNVPGSAAFGKSTDADNAFQVIKDIHDALANGNTAAVGATLDRLDSRINKLLEVRSQVGARSNRISLIQNRLQDINTNLQSMQSKTEDADMAEVITNLKMSQNVYQSSLSAGAKLISPSLLDFLH